MIVENVDRRVLGALRCVDAVTKAQVLGPVVVQSDRLHLRRNGSNIWVVFNAPGMRLLTTQFDVSSTWPDSTPITVTVRSVSGRYLPRRVDIDVPGKLKKVDNDNPPPAMVPQDVVLYPAPTASSLPNWALVRVSVTQNTTGVAAPWAVLQVTRITGDPTPLATGMANSYGEALLAIPGLGISASQDGGGAVSETTIDAKVTAFWDPETPNPPTTSTTRSDQEKFANWVANPDLILKDLSNKNWKSASTTKPVQIGRATLSQVNLQILV